MKTAPILYQTTALGQIAYYEQGSGKTILLLHGFPDTPHTYEAQVDYLSERGYRCIIPFLPGYGESSLPSTGGSTVLALGQMMSQFLHQLVGQEPVIICGHDWGSMITQMMVSLNNPKNNPKRSANPASNESSNKTLNSTSNNSAQNQPNLNIERIILCALPSTRAFARNFNIAQLRSSSYIYYFQMPGVVNRLLKQDLAYLRNLSQRASPSLSPEHPKIVELMGILKTGDNLKKSVSYYRAFNPITALLAGGSPFKQLKLMLQIHSLPCLFIAGAEDHAIRAEMFNDCEREYPHPETRRLVFENCGHFMQFEQPDIFNAELGAFIGIKEIFASPRKKIF